MMRPRRGGAGEYLYSCEPTCPIFSSSPDFFSNVSFQVLLMDQFLKGQSHSISNKKYNPDLPTLFFFAPPDVVENISFDTTRYNVKSRSKDMIKGVFHFRCLTVI